MTKKYDLAIVLPYQNGEDASDGFGDKLKTVLKKVGGEVVNVDEWGDKALAYPINGYDRGLYFVYTVELKPGKVEDLSRRMRLVKGLLRWILTEADGITVKVEDKKENSKNLKK